MFCLSGLVYGMEGHQCFLGHTDKFSCSRKQHCFRGILNPNLTIQSLWKEIKEFTAFHIDHYENMPMQYTEILKVVKNEIFSSKFLLFFSFLLRI